MSLLPPARLPARWAAGDGARWIPAAAAALAITFGGCDEGRPPGVLPDATYVAVMARLGVVLESESAEPDARAFDPDSARAAILAAYGVTAEDLTRYAARFGDDPDHMHEVWSAIADSARALRQRWATEDGVLELPEDVGRAEVEGGPGGVRATTPDSGTTDAAGADTSGIPTADTSGIPTADTSGAPGPDAPSPDGPDDLGRVP